MGNNLKALEKRRQELQNRSAKERQELATHFEPWEKPLSWADKGIDTLISCAITQFYGVLPLQCWPITSQSWLAKRSLLVGVQWSFWKAPRASFKPF